MVLSEYQIAELPLAGGFLGIAPIPGRHGAYAADLNVILRWDAGMVITMTHLQELDYVGAGNLSGDLAAAGVAWRHMPVVDFDTPGAGGEAGWRVLSAEALALLGQGRRVMVHCFAGCGRAGMAALRLMIDAGEEPMPALVRLRAARPCAVQTEAQFAWAARLVG